MRRTRPSLPTAGAANTSLLARGAVAIVLGIVAAPAADIDTPPGSGDVLPPPHQVEAVVRPADHSGDALTLGPPFVVVALGAADTGPRPRRDGSDTWTLLGTHGSMSASLLEITKACTYFDDNDEMETCRYEAHVAPAGPLDAIGAPVAALPGAFSISEFVVMSSPAASHGATTSAASQPAAADEPVKSRNRPVAAGGGSKTGRMNPHAEAEEEDSAAMTPVPVVENFAEPIWPEENPERSRYRLVRKSEGYVYEYAWGNAGPFEMQAGDCSASARGPLTRVRCEVIEALYDGDEMLLAAVADYAGPAADAHATLVHAGRTYLLLRFSLKAQTIWGLLYQDNDGAWHALIRPRDYALLC